MLNVFLLAPGLGKPFVLELEAVIKSRGFKLASPNGSDLIDGSINTYFNLLESMNQADVFIVAVDETDGSQKLVNTCLDMLSTTASNRSARTTGILRQRADGLLHINPWATWFCGYAYGTGKVLVTYSEDKKCPIMQQAALAHVHSVDALDRLLVDLVEVDGTDSEKAQALLKIKVAHESHAANQ